MGGTAAQAGKFYPTPPGALGQGESLLEVQSPVGVAGGQADSDRGETVPAGVGALPDGTVSQLLGNKGRDGAAAHSAAAVALGVGADKGERFT